MYFSFRFFFRFLIRNRLNKIDIYIYIYIYPVGLPLQIIRPYIAYQIFVCYIKKATQKLKQKSMNSKISLTLHIYSLHADTEQLWWELEEMDWE